MKQNDEKANFASRWSPHIERFGFVSLPLAVFYFKKELGITASEIEIFCYIEAHRWRKDKLPHPSLKQIALKSGKSESAVRTNVRALIKKGLLLRFGIVGDTNRYSPTPLIEKLEALIKASNRPSYFQQGERLKATTPPYLKTHTELDKAQSDIESRGQKPKGFPIKKGETPKEFINRMKPSNRGVKKDNGD